MRAAILLSALIAALPATAQTGYPPPTPTVLGSYTVDTLPLCAAETQGRYAFATDLGGGADTVLCDGTSWKHIRLGAPFNITATGGTVTVTPLKSAPVLFITGSILTTMTLQLDTTNLYPGYILYVRVPGALTGSLGIKLLGGAVIPIVGNSTSIFIYDGTALQRIQ